MVHAALLLLMLEAVTTDLVSTISLKRSTQNLQLSTSCRPITQSIGEERTLARWQHFICRDPFGCTFSPGTPRGQTTRAEQSSQTFNFLGLLKLIRHVRFAPNSY